jgi:hypothetical protein
MQRITLSLEYRGSAAPPQGEPPQTDPQAMTVSIEARAADGAHFDVRQASYENHATYTGPTTFSETGTVRFDDGGAELDIATVVDGTLEPSPDPDLLHGAVIYRIIGGRERFEGASGLITSNFVLRPAAGEFDERQVAVVFIP